MKADYVQAVIELLEAGYEPSKVVDGLTKTLTAHRQLPLLRPVLERVLVVLEASDRAHVVVSVVDEAALESQKEHIAAAIKSLKADDAPQKVVIDPSLVGGSVVRFGHQAVDGSYKQALVQLYRSITTE